MWVKSLRPLGKIASGGELSRIMLSLKAILATQESVETLIFDEVDAGIGGRVAEVVGQSLLSLSRFHQVICITHLPQIAQFGEHHFKIVKGVEKGRTRTTIKPLRRRGPCSGDGPDAWRRKNHKEDTGSCPGNDGGYDRDAYS